MNKEGSEQEIKLLSPIQKPNKSLSSPKYSIILISTLLSLGKNYCYNIPQALETQFLKGDFELTNIEFDLFYSIFSFPNIILPFFGGIFIDKLGNRIALMLFSSFIICGQFLFLMGTSLLNYPLLVLGRLFFGLGSEILQIAQTTIVVKWVDEKEVGFVIALQTAVSKIGGLVNSPVTPKLYDDSNGFFLPVFVGLMVCAISYLAAFFVCLFDKRYEFLLNNGDSVSNERRILIGEIRKFDIRFWLITLETFLIVGSYFSFTSNENHILRSLFKLPSETAGLMLISVYILGTILPPFFGFLSDLYGKKALTIVFFIICFILAVLLLEFIPSDSGLFLILIPLLLHGIFLGGFFTIIWISVPVLVGREVLGTAYGVFSSIYNLNQTVSPLIFGAIEDRTKSKYFWGLIFVIFQGIFSLFVGVLVVFFDRKIDGKLDRRPGTKS